MNYLKKQGEYFSYDNLKQSISPRNQANVGINKSRGLVQRQQIQNMQMNVQKQSVSSLGSGLNQLMFLQTSIGGSRNVIKQQNNQKNVSPPTKIIDLSDKKIIQNKQVSTSGTNLLTQMTQTSQNDLGRKVSVPQISLKQLKYPYQQHIVNSPQGQKMKEILSPRNMNTSIDNQGGYLTPTNGQKIQALNGNQNQQQKNGFFNVNSAGKNNQTERQENVIKSQENIYFIKQGLKGNGNQNEKNSITERKFSNPEVQFQSNKQNNNSSKQTSNSNIMVTQINQTNTEYSQIKESYLLKNLSVRQNLKYVNNLNLKKNHLKQENKSFQNQIETPRKSLSFLKLNKQFEAVQTQKNNPNTERVDQSTKKTKLNNYFNENPNKTVASQINKTTTNSANSQNSINKDLFEEGQEKVKQYNQSNKINLQNIVKNTIQAPPVQKKEEENQQYMIIQKVQNEEQPNHQNLITQEYSSKLDQFVQIPQSSSNQNNVQGSQQQIHNSHLYPIMTQRNTESVSEAIRSSQHLDDFHFEKTLGLGSYAVVRLATHKLTGCKVAIKSYDKSKINDAQRKKNVSREIKILSKLRHTNIIKLYSVIETNNHISLIMEYRKSVPLNQFLKKFQFERVSEKAAYIIFNQLIQALAYIHRKGVVHRDIKLENILIDECLNIQLIDFGFSIAIGSDQKLNIFCGTPSYMAPEIVNKEEYDHLVDIWALGVVLFRIVTGFFPFTGMVDKELYQNINNCILDYPLKLSSNFKDLMSKILQKDVNLRLQAKDILQEDWMTQKTKTIEVDILQQQFENQSQNKIQNSDKKSNQNIEYQGLSPRKKNILQNQDITN